MKGKKMIATEVIEKKNQQTDDFAERLEHYRLAVKNGQEVEASIIQMDTLAKYGAMIE